MPKHILVPFNDSESSRKAFKKALSIAKKNDAKITVVFVTCYYYGHGYAFDETLGAAIISAMQEKNRMEEIWPGLEKQAKILI